MVRAREPALRLTRAQAATRQIEAAMVTPSRRCSDAEVTSSFMGASLASLRSEKRKGRSVCCGLALKESYHAAGY
jgi:hypothetical protein